MQGLRVNAMAFFWGALLLLTVPLRWLLAAGLAMAVHELFHFAALRLLGGHALEIQLSPRGALMETCPLSPGRELLCTLAGPVGSLLLLCLLPLLPRTALCGLVQGIYNLLPVYPLDGGRILFCLARLLGLERFLPLTERLVLGLLFLLALAGTFLLRLGLFPILGVMALFLGKRPCKPGSLGVQ